MTQLVLQKSSPKAGRVVNWLLLATVATSLILASVSILAFYTVYLGCAFKMGHAPQYNIDPNPNAPGYPLDASLTELCDKTIGMTFSGLLWLFPAYQIAHLILWLKKIVSRRTSIAIIFIQLFWLWSILFSPMAEWYAD